MRILLIVCSLCISVLVLNGQDALPAKVYPYEDRTAGTTTKSASPRSMEQSVRMFLSSAPANNSAILEYALSRLNETFAHLEKERIRRKSPGKAGQLVRQELRRSYLKIFEPYAGFDELFKRNVYNSATASVLYALILDHFDIPYQIFADRGRYYPVIDPQGEHLIIEELQHLGGRAASRDLYLSEANSLLDALRLMPGNPLHREFLAEAGAGGARLLSPVQLSGVLYFQQALHLYCTGQFPQALDQLDQAALYYPHAQLELVRQAARWQLARIVDENTPESLEPLFDLYATQPIPAVRAELLHRFAKMSKYWLNQVAQPRKLEEIYGFFSRKLDNDTELFQQLREIYFFELAQYFAQSYQVTEAVRYLDSIYRFRPADAGIQDILGKLLVRSLRNQRDFKAGLDMVASFRNKYPFLINNDHFKDLDLFYQAERIRHLFATDQEMPALQYVGDFEQALTRAGRTPQGKSWITTVYATASNFYFRWGDFAGARRMIFRGLALSPEDPYFLHQAEFLQNYY